MTAARLILSTRADAELIEQLGAGLTASAAPHVSGPGFQPLALRAVDAEDRFLGGVDALINWNWLHLRLFWLEEAARGQGLGSRMLKLVEDTARARGCTDAHLDTFAWQARPFYERHGWEVFATLDDYPTGQARYFMRKRL